MKEAGLIGFPLSHSFSRDYFTKKFQSEGIQGFRYLNFEIESADQLDKLFSDHPYLIGLNVTIPHKQSVIPLLDELSDEAEEIGAVNTICIDRSGLDPYLTGHNTDHIGFSETLDQVLDYTPRGALVLGTGGASKAVIYVLNKRDIPYVLVSRSEGLNKISYNDLDAEILSSNPLIINTSPLGMFPDIERKPNIPYQHLNSQNCLIDLIYNPSQTQFLKLGLKAGAKIINGLPMLISQAEASWKLWNS